MIAEWPGFCPTCESPTSHVQYGEWLRDELVCRRCASNPRLRAIAYVMSLLRPNWREQRVWELAPAGPMSAAMQESCPSYTSSHYWPGVEPGASHNGIRCENVECPTFDDASFDIVIASDVFEHVFDIDRALKEISRTLSPDGVFIWTVPQQGDLVASRPRARRDGESIEHLLPPDYHCDPVSDEGSLVTFDWGQDLPELVEQASGMTTSVFRIESKVLGVLGAHIEVFVSCPSVDGWAAGVHRERDRVARDIELSNTMDTLREHVAESEATVQTLLAQLAKADETREQLERHLEHTAVLASSYKDEAAALRASTSWRVTRPLRGLSGLVGRGSES